MVKSTQLNMLIVYIYILSLPRLLLSVANFYYVCQLIYFVRLQSKTQFGLQYSAKNCKKTLLY